jgi:hypothetical protein
MKKFNENLLEKSSILNIDLLRIPSRIDDAKNVTEFFFYYSWKIDQRLKRKFDFSGRF